MIIDKMDTLKALDHYDIRVARTKVVDSAEDAIAFSERRNARDPRLMPIVLRPVSAAAQGHAKSAAEKPLTTEEAIREAYDRMVREAGTTYQHILAQEATEHGTDITISGATDDALGKTITLHSATHAIQHMTPLDAGGAETLVRNFEGFHHRGSREKTRLMLEHLLVKVSKLFDEAPVTAFQLDVRLHENSYTVIDASMTSPKALHLKERLDPRAHDRKGDDYHPAGRE